MPPPRAAFEPNITAAKAAQSIGPAFVTLFKNEHPGTLGVLISEPLDRLYALTAKEMGAGYAQDEFRGHMPQAVVRTALVNVSKYIERDKKYG